MKTILMTGSTDGIGLATAERLVRQGHRVLIHGRNPEKLQATQARLSAATERPNVEGHVADLSRLADVEDLAEAVASRHARLDVLINNAGVFRVPDPLTDDGLDVRFAVNTIAPYLLTRRLLPLMAAGARVINLSSAAQAPVDIDALAGRGRLDDEFSAYAQSKLALTMWSRHLAMTLNDRAPAIIAVNPGSLLGSKMVKEGFGVAGNDLQIGVDILNRAALDDAFAHATGQYFDNDAKRFASPHADALEAAKCERVVRVIEDVLARLGTPATGP
ncbi:Rhamnolipids biosynthesis 3-oxoacyl-[acyl-carrier-protein] reductase [Halomonas sp. THAF5a]|uniref:SDR family NAD(P)-dependent oxidoreductase n=1 Tax=Halomonas sp. THAF5a TaxID=2587844 RepID=UPI0012A9C9B9|nr:SDR family NAD(P)-dependent oxidoreductase [Halomonas sp. THAF5a]QFU01986.1 Rhamnolipids biosynthesis 3-oxoacyl-[acyl-carrier-protein] reductase [Halomonas sp. THAF5a]